MRWWRIRLWRMKMWSKKNHLLTLIALAFFGGLSLLMFIDSFMIHP